MTDYQTMTNEELNRLVAERIEPEPTHVADPSSEFGSLSHAGGWKLGLGFYEPRDFVNDWSATGWLLEREQIGIQKTPHISPLWLAVHPNTYPTHFGSELPGRAVCIAYLESETRGSE